RPLVRAAAAGRGAAVKAPSGLGRQTPPRTFTRAREEAVGRLEQGGGAPAASSPAVRRRLQREQAAKGGTPLYPQRDTVSRRRPPPGVRQTPEQMKAWREQAVRELTAGRCPDFSLAPLKEYPREVLLSESGADANSDRERLKRLTLMLALAFNDLKDL